MQATFRRLRAFAGPTGYPGERYTRWPQARRLARASLTAMVDADSDADGVEPERAQELQSFLGPEPDVADASATIAEDHAAIRRAQAGDEQGFRELVERHQSRAWRVARNLVGSDEDAQDLAQEAFLRVFRSVDKFDFEHAFTTWLYRIVTNLAIDHLRKRRPVHSTTREDDEEPDLDVPDASVEQPSDRMERGELAREVKACLESLAPHFQSVLVLREMEGLPCKEIADIVGATHVTVRWRLHRGRKLFQEEWERRARFRDSSGASSLPLSRTANNDDELPVDESEFEGMPDDESAT
ncbi:MAG: RNA polymerase sigma factor [Planctomycetota bacterium]